MTLKRLCLLLETYGAAPARWPAGERAAALALLARSPTARALADAAGGLDRLLDAAPPPPPSAALRAAVIALNRATPAPVAAASASASAGRRTAATLAAALLAAALRWLSRGVVLRPAALAAAFAVGVFAGGVATSGRAPPPARLDYLATVSVAEVTGGATEIIVSELLEDELWPINGFITLAWR